MDSCLFTLSGHLMSHRSKVSLAKFGCGLFRAGEVLLLLLSRQVHLEICPFMKLPNQGRIEPLN